MTAMNNYELITILGPTACGKTPLAAQLCHQIGGEVISADSRMVYRGMTIGSGKDLEDYIVDGEQVPYHIIDIAEAGYKVFPASYGHSAVHHAAVGTDDLTANLVA